MELKLEKTTCPLHDFRSFNQTKMELKLEYASQGSFLEKSFNQTKMELKPLKKEDIWLMEKYF